MNIDNSNDFANQDGVTVYLKDGSTARIIVPGKVESVQTENYVITVKTNSNIAAFDASNVSAVVFGKHSADKNHSQIV